MSVVGIFCPPASGHLNPIAALGRTLQKRGHRVIVFQLPDLQSKVESEGLAFVSFAGPDYQSGQLQDTLDRIAQLKGLKAFREMLKSARSTARLIFEHGPDVVKKKTVELLLVDQNEPMGAALAEYLQIPFISISAALPLNREPDVPPQVVGWSYHPNFLSRLRNWLGYKLMGLAISPLQRALNHYRALWQLPSLRTPDESFSHLAELCQMPKSFDFPRHQLPSWFHYIGPLRDEHESQIPFPWEKLDGRPLIFASLGTLQTGKGHIFSVIAKACETLPYQLVICHAGALHEAEIARLPGNPLVVHYGPQRALLQKAALTITHGGLNTVLDSLSFGVPMVAIPIAYEQPAIAARVQWSGTGKVIPYSKLSADRLQAIVQEVLQNPNYRNAAQELAKSIQQAGGVGRAADIVEEVLQKR